MSRIALLLALFFATAFQLDGKVLLDLDHAAARLGCSPRWLANQLRTKRFPARKLARKWMLGEDDLQEILRICATPAMAAPLTDSAIDSAPQATSSMTRTTARRMHQDDQ